MRTRWSQNFLVNPGVAQACVQALDLSASDEVLEIGPGRGVLTALLLEKTPDVTAVEIDPELSQALTRRFGSQPGFRLIGGDFLEVPKTKLPKPSGKNLKVIGNLPYAVVSPILQKLLGWRKWKTSVVMVQKEVGDRILGKPGTKDYSVLTVSIQSRCLVEKVCLVSRHSFRPPPKVESIVLRLTPLARPVFKASEEKRFFAVVKGAFAHRRKTVLNSLSRSMSRPTEEIRGALAQAGISPQARGETLGLDDFKKLSEILY